MAPEARFVHADLRDAAAVSETVSDGFDGVLHFAALALVGESVSHPERYYHANVVGTMNLLDAMRDAGVPRLVFSSTCAVYGQPDEVPMSEATPYRPTSAYGASKLASDKIFVAANNLSGSVGTAQFFSRQSQAPWAAGSRPLAFRMKWSTETGPGPAIASQANITK